jgi:hypothetical protein
MQCFEQCSVVHGKAVHCTALCVRVSKYQCLYVLLCMHVSFVYDIAAFSLKRRSASPNRRSLRPSILPDRHDPLSSRVCVCGCVYGHIV